MKLALGTVQWGMNYGISNSNGVPSDEELNKIFNKMESVGIDTLDTAVSYGYAEKRLGKFISSSHKIISKADTSLNKKTIKEQCKESLSFLGQSILEGYLLHNVKDLFESQIIWKELSELKDLGLVKKIGISFYDPLDLKRVLNSGIIPDIVQLPFNILDRRFSQYFSQLKGLGVEIHVRSVFLQGILIKAYNYCPKSFEQWDPHWRIYREWINNSGISPIEGCIQHALSYDLIDKIIIGITSLNELDEIISSQSLNPLRAPEELEIKDQKLINPSEWLLTK